MNEKMKTNKSYTNKTMVPIVFFLLLVMGITTVSAVNLVAEQGQDNNLHAYKHKLNNATLSLLEKEDKEKERDFIIAFENVPDESLLHTFSIKKRNDKLKKILAKGKLGEAKKLLKNNHIRFIEEDQNISFQAITPWGVERVQAPQAWNETTGLNTKVGVLDSGIAQHPALQIAGGVSVLGGDFSDRYGHGTQVAGVIAAQGDITGVSPDVELYAIKIIENESGRLSDALAGLDWAIDNGMNISTMSF